MKGNYTGGPTVEGDILVGADGGYSRRQCLPDHNPMDVNARGIYAKTSEYPRSVEAIQKAYGGMADDELG